MANSPSPGLENSIISLIPRYSELLGKGSVAADSIRKGTAMATSYTGSARMVAHNMVTTQFELDGFRVTRTLGVVRGIVVRSRSIFGTIGAGLQTLVGGNITLLTNLSEKTRSEAFDLVLQHAADIAGERAAGGQHAATRATQGGTAGPADPTAQTW